MRQDILRLENYGIPVGETIYDYSTPYGNYGKPRIPYEYNFQYQFIDPNQKGLSLERGDVFKFGPQVRPKHARNQMGVVIDRYKKVKNKYVIFNDYCLVVMVITGPTKGRTFRMSMNFVSHLLKTIGGTRDD